MRKTIVALMLILICFNIVGCTTSDYDYDDVETNAPTDQSCDHSWSAATCDSPEKCDYCGEIRGAALGHNFSNATCTEAKKCTVCGLTEGSPTGHNFSNATCLTPKKCQNCGITEGEIGSHDYQHGSDGSDTCSVCGNNSFESLCMIAMEYHLQTLKDPSSAQVYGVYAGHYDRSYNEYESGDYVVVIIDSSANNSFGGVVREDYICLFDYKNNKVIYDLKGTGESQKKLYGQAALSGIEMEIEAVTLSAQKTSFQKQDHKHIFDVTKNKLGY